MDKVRYAVIGIGNMGSAHARALFNGEIENAVLTCVADINPERREWAAENFGGSVSIFEDYEELLAAGMADAVIIATPHYLHTVIAIKAFALGYHVLTEKPAGVDASEVAVMNEKAAESGRAFGIMFNQRTTPVFETLKYYIEIGVLGDIKRFCWIVDNWYRTQAYYNSAGWRASWNGEGGGVLLNQCPHNLDIWQWIMGMPSVVRAFCKEGKYHDISVEDDVTIYAEYPNGATAIFISSTGEYPGTNRIEISGTMGKAVVEEGLLKLFLLERDEREIRFDSKESMPSEEVKEVTVSFKDTPDGHLLIIRNFTGHILNGEPLIAPGEEGINSLRISNAAYLSSWTNTEIAFPFDGEKFTYYLEQKKHFEKVRTAVESHEHAEGEYSSRWSVRW